MGCQKDRLLRRTPVRRGKAKKRITTHAACLSNKSDKLWRDHPEARNDLTTFHGCLDNWSCLAEVPNGSCLMVWHFWVWRGLTVLPERLLRIDHVGGALQAECTCS